jgi:hypothetical protein
MTGHIPGMSDLLGVLGSIHRATQSGVTITGAHIESGEPAAINRTRRTIYIDASLDLVDWCRAVSAAIEQLDPTAEPRTVGSTIMLAEPAPEPKPGRHLRSV